MGVPVDVRKDASARREVADPFQLGSEWENLDFYHYAKIICSKENWAEIFKTQFILEKSDMQKNKEDLTSFLTKLDPIRNAIAHSRSTLSEEDVGFLKASKAHFEKIYQKWLGA